MRQILGLVVLAALAASCGGDSGSGSANGGTVGGGSGGAAGASSCSGIGCIGQGGAGGTAASGNPTDEQVIRFIGPAACERIRVCLPDAYPGGAAACLEGVLSTEPPSKLSESSPCSVPDGQACAADLQTFSCAGIMQGTLPSSCMKCDISKTPQTGPNGNVQQVLGFTGHTLCKKVQSCNPQAFAQSYPAGVQACVAQAIGAVPAATLAQPSTCTDAMAAACNADLKAVSCDSLGMHKVPTSCEGCL